jgi:hypothetical protein
VNPGQRTDCVPQLPTFTVDVTDVVGTDGVVARCANTMWAVRIAGMLNAASLQGAFDD